MTTSTKSAGLVVERTFTQTGQDGFDGVVIKESTSSSHAAESVTALTAAPDLNGPPQARRHRLQDDRMAVTHKFAFGGHEGFLIVGLYPNGQPGEVFIRMSKEGSTISGLMDSFAMMVSVALQHGVPLASICDKLSHTRFDPSGWTGNETMGYAKSPMDYIGRWLKHRFLDGEQMSLFTMPQTAVSQSVASVPTEAVEVAPHYGDAPNCGVCGSIMQASGSKCFKCTCGSNVGGCS